MTDQTATDYGNGWARVVCDVHLPGSPNIIADIHPPEDDDPAGMFYVTWRQSKEPSFTRAEITRLWQALAFMLGKATP